MLRRGLSAIRELKNRQQDYDSDSARRLILKGGETALVRFYGNFESDQDPVITTTHYVKRLARGDQYQNCGESIGQPCVFCYERDQHNDRGIGKSNRALFACQDFRKTHRLEQEVQVLRPGVIVMPGRAGNPGDYVTTKYPECKAKPGAAPCMYCKQGNIAKLNGFRYWELSVSFADQLVQQQHILRTYCLCKARAEDGSGTIFVQQYQCQHCKKEVEFFPEKGIPVVTCKSCRRSLPPLEIIACSACKNPRRCSIQDFYFRVSRTGETTDTAYNFEPVQPARPPSHEELEAAKNAQPNWEKIVAPEPPEMQAALLNVNNPFPATHGHGSTPYAQQANGSTNGGPPSVPRSAEAVARRRLSPEAYAQELRERAQAAQLRPTNQAPVQAPKPATGGLRRLGQPAPKVAPLPERAVRGLSGLRRLSAPPLRQEDVDPDPYNGGGTSDDIPY